MSRVLYRMAWPASGTGGAWRGLRRRIAVFQWGWLACLIGVPATGPVASFLPIIVTAVLRSP